MSAIRPEDFMRFFEKTTGARFVDVRTGRPALEVLQEEIQKSDYDRWLEEQDEATQRQYKMGEF
jgi:post-segregation antitoxin (ccd killing protein)